MSTIVVIDYHKGNLSSVARGLARAGADAVVSDDPERIRAADGLVLPGVGSFYDAIAFMRASGQDGAVVDALAGGEGTPFLGICLGLQLLFERGDEGVPDDAPLSDAADRAGSNLAPGTVFAAEGRRWVRGLGLLPGSCTLLPSRRLKVPHVGWDQVHLTPTGAACPLLEGFDEGANVYFTHSYALDGDVDAADIAARTFYARDFGSVVWHGNIYGCQFHPEKSSAHGHLILENFVRIVDERVKEVRA
ncbi:glutamine amidotransferase-related protein [Collinsella tanakaei]|uniref:glutamine amidotransferase-related protein n=1 Tax=Collinsella tanakaei TaxID=626935 RepID=UPI0025A31888|nr:imidazole glycerol phosphate synthase subunit HisH [Collinsella tanakaei]MDM8302611.1 imidazole glycerol phosphate synthase subunit HisH [Collinsella tanakaei]